MITIDANEIQHSITLEQMYLILEDLGGQPTYIDDSIVSKTICHGGNSHKLYYYDNSKRFTCYTGNCGTGFSIFDLVQWVKGIEFFPALQYVCNMLGIENTGEYNHTERLDMSFFNKFKPKSVEKDISLPTYPKNSLAPFRDLYHISWVNDNITTKSMMKYNIKFNILNNQIIIPHYDIEDNLCGIRVRNLNKKDLDAGRKYMPLFYHGKDYRHNLGQNLYALNMNKYNIDRTRQIILFEGEKSVLQLESYLESIGNNSVAISGSNLTQQQINLINRTQASEIVIALDKEYHHGNYNEEKIYATKIKEKFINPLMLSHKISIIWDVDNLLDYKDSPTDKGYRIWQKLYEDRIMIGGI